MMLKSVLLPQPDGPTIETNSRSAATRSTPSSARTGVGLLGKIFATLLSARATSANSTIPFGHPGAGALNMERGGWPYSGSPTVGGPPPGWQAVDPGP